MEEAKSQLIQAPAILEPVPSPPVARSSESRPWTAPPIKTQKPAAKAKAAPASVKASPVKESQVVYESILNLVLSERSSWRVARRSTLDLDP